MSPAERFLERLEAVKTTGARRWQARCPAHDDTRPSLAVTEKTTGDVLIHCHAGCPTEDVVAAVQLEAGDLFAERRNGHEPEAVYRYVDEHDRALFEVVRLPGKQFRQRRPDGQWGLNGARRVIYRLPRVIEAAKRGQRVFVVEGEKDVAALDALGHVATCNPGGAGKWRKDYAETLRGARVVVVADRDEPGRAHARQVAESLKGVAAKLDVVEPAVGKDISDHLAAGKSRNDLVEGSGLPSGVVSGVMVASALRPATRDTLPKLRFLDIERMVREEPPPVPWVVEGFVAQGALTALVAKYGEGKSLLSAALAAGVALGAREAGFACRQGRVVIVDAENGEHEIHRRVRALGLPGGGIKVAEAEQDFDLRHDLELLERVLDEHRPHLLVLDSFRSLWRGDENDSGEVAAVLDPLRNLVRTYEAGAVILHHAGKQSGIYRGSSAIGASIELGFTLARAEGDPDRDRRYVECWKCRPAPEPSRRWLRLAVDLGQVFVDEAEPFGDEPEQEQRAPRSSGLTPRVLAALAPGAMKLADLARAVGEDPKNRTVRRVLEALDRNGDVERLEDGSWGVRCQPPKGHGTMTPDTLSVPGNVEASSGAVAVEPGGGGPAAQEVEAAAEPTCSCGRPRPWEDEDGRYCLMCRKKLRRSA